MSRIAAFLHRIVEWGHNIWFDEGIPGGAEWDSLIESKIAHCELFLTFISQTAVESKWVRREVKFADSENKPILAIKLEEAELKYGLKMLLSQYQIIDARKPAFPVELRKAIIYIKGR